MARRGLCVMCKKAAALDPQSEQRGTNKAHRNGAFKLLPCLHICCIPCLDAVTQEAAHKGQGSPADKVRNHYGSRLFACPECKFKIHLPRDGVEGLKALPLYMREETRDCAAEFSLTDNVMMPQHNIDCNETPNIAHTSEKPVCLDHNDPVDGGSKQSTVYPKCQLQLGKCPTCEAALHRDMTSYCNACDSVTCLTCQERLHACHSCSKMACFLENKTDYMSKILADLEGKIEDYHEKLACIGRGEAHLRAVREQVRDDILQRSHALTLLIERRKQDVLHELDGVCDRHLESYDRESRHMFKQVGEIQDVRDFGQDLIAGGLEQDVFDYHSDVTNQCLRLLHQVPQPAVSILGLKLDIPAPGKEQAALERLFGSLTQGAIRCGNANLVGSFSTALQWPTCMAVTQGKEVAIGGKTGAFDSTGKVLIFNKHGQKYVEVDVEDGEIPCDMKPLPEGGLLVSTSGGRLIRMAMTGRVIESWTPPVGGGLSQFGLRSDGTVVVHSADVDEFKVVSCASGEHGEVTGSFASPPASDTSGDIVRPHCLITDTNDNVIATDVKNRQVVKFDKRGKVLLHYTGPDGHLAGECVRRTDENNRRNTETGTKCDTSANELCDDAIGIMGSAKLVGTEASGGEGKEKEYPNITSEKKNMLANNVTGSIYQTSNGISSPESEEKETNNCLHSNQSSKQLSVKQPGENLSHDTSHVMGETNLVTSVAKHVTEASDCVPSNPALIPAKSMSNTSAAGNKHNDKGETRLQGTIAGSAAKQVDSKTSVATAASPQTTGLQCPTAVCSDPFNNILVADFTRDNVHLISGSGSFLGYLLTKANGLSCPNCMVLDSEGHLILGQYGGDVLVFQYLSYIKHA